MSSASDISNLFQMTGGDPSQYQEVERTEQMQGVRKQWTVLPADQSDRIAALPGAVVVPSEPPATSATDTVLAAAAGVVETIPHVDTIEAQAATPPRLIAWTIPPVATEPPPVLPGAAPQAGGQVSPEPAAAPQQSAELSSVFARLLERDTSRTRDPQHRSS